MREIQFSAVHEFNTGCHYSNEGQPIKWAGFTCEGVTGIVFKDRARMITKCIPVAGTFGYTQYQGVVEPKVIYGKDDSAYVGRCEKEGIYHSDYQTEPYEARVVFDVENAFNKLVS